jgi:hypothetical protein
VKGVKWKKNNFTGNILFLKLGWGHNNVIIILHLCLMHLIKKKKEQGTVGVVYFYPYSCLTSRVNRHPGKLYFKVISKC